jgi:Chaperone of endosialidase
MAFAACNLTNPAVPLTPADVCAGFIKCAGPGVPGIKMNSGGFNSFAAYIEGLTSSGDKFISGFGYVPATGVLTVTRSDAATFTATIPDVSVSVKGLVNNVLNQELGGVDKLNNGLALGRGAANEVFSVAHGYIAGGSLLLGTGGVSIGAFSNAASSGTYRTAVGRNAGRASVGSNNVYMGGFAGDSGNASSSVAVGHLAGNTVNDDRTTIVGASAGQNSIGLNSVALGFRAGATNSAVNQILLGAQAGESSAAADFIGIGLRAGQFNTFTGTVAIGTDSVNSANNQIMLGNASTTADIRSFAPFNAPAYNVVSDARNKTDVKPIDVKKAIEFATALNWVEYNLLTDFYAIEFANKTYADGHAAKIQELKAASKSKDSDDEVKADANEQLAEMKKPEAIERRELGRDYGLIAQEVQKLTKAVGAFGEVVITGPGGSLSLNYRAIDAIVSRAVQAKVFGK